MELMKHAECACTFFIIEFQKSLILKFNKMKVKYLIAAFSAVVLVSACDERAELAPQVVDAMLSATVEGNSGTRVGFDESGSFYWSFGDKLGVTTSVNTEKFSVLTLSSGGGTGSGTFNGQVSGEIYGYAVYPYSESHSISGSTLSYNLASNYTYEKVDADYFSSEQGMGNSFNSPMWGEISNGKVQMKHLGGVLCIKISDMPLAAGKLLVVANKKIAGDFTTELNGGTPVLSSVETSDVDNTVTIEFANATQHGSGTFYVPVPVGSYDIRIKMVDNTVASTESMNVAAGVYVVERCNLKKIELVTGSIDATVESLDVAASNLADKDVVSVTNEISSDNSISIPAVDGSTEVSKALVLESVASGASISVNDANSGLSDASVNNFTLSIPKNETDGFIPLDVDINMPNTTVTLSANADAAAYGEVTAETAENTLIVDGGVSVKKIIVEKGNLRVCNGAKIEALERASGNTATVTVYAEEGAEIPELPEGFEKASAEIADMEAVAANGGTYTLGSDLVLSRPLVVEKDMILDLNGHSLKPNASGLEKVLNTSDAIVLVRRGAELTVNDSQGNGSIDANGVSSVYAAVKLTDTNDGTDGNIAKVTINGGDFIGYTAGISGNGTRHNTEIVINKGNIKGQETGIYHPQYGKLTINGGIISGDSTGVELRSGVLEVTGGEIISNSTKFSAKPNGNGTTISGAAIAVSQHVTNKDISVSITGGVMRGIYAFYEADLQDGNVGNISISPSSNARFEGKVYSQNCSAFVKGGTFTDPNALQYLGENADVKVELAENTDCAGFVTRSGQRVEINLNEYEMTLTDPTVGSTGTETNSCQLLQGSTVTFMNGTIISNNPNIVIQNYCNLTLDRVTLNTPKASYSISNNNGCCNLLSTTINAASGGYAFDVYYWSANGYYDGVSVIVENSVINGNVQFGGDRASGDTTKKGLLNVLGSSVLNGNLKVNTDYYDESVPNIVVANTVTIGENATGWSDYISEAD